MGKTLNCDIFSQKSIDQLRKDLRLYKNELIKKTKEFVNRLVGIGVNVEEAKIGESPLGKYIKVKTDIKESRTGSKAMILAIGEVKENENYPDFDILLAVEFGAGIHYNKKENPTAREYGYGVGTFPGQVHAFQNEGWMYWDEAKQTWIHTYGVKATMPVYEARLAIMKNIEKVAREVFGR